MFLLTLACWCGAAYTQTQVTDGLEGCIEPRLQMDKLVTLPGGERRVVSQYNAPSWEPAALRAASKAAYDSKGYRLDSVVSAMPGGVNYTRQCFKYDDAGKIVRQEDSYWDSASEAWTARVTTYIWTWTENGYLKTSEQIDANGNGQKHEYKYNDRNLGIEDVFLRKNVRNGDKEYKLYSKGEYGYDDKGNMTLEVVYKHDGSQWVPTQKNTAEYTYDGDEITGKSTATYTYNGTKWVGKAKQDLAYSKKGRTTYFCNYSWERETPDAFEPFSRIWQVFQEANDTVLTEQSFEFYNLETDTWTGNFVDRNGAERYNIKGQKEFDGKNRETLSYASTLYGDKWFQSTTSRTVYTDNADGSYESVENIFGRLYEGPEADPQYTLKETVTERYNPMGLCTYHFDDVHFDKSKSQEFEARYDEKGNNIFKEEYRFNASGEKSNYLKFENTFDEWNNIIETYNWKGRDTDGDKINEEWVSSNHFTYTYEKDGTVRVDKKCETWDAVEGAYWKNWGEGGRFDYSVSAGDIIVPAGYNSEYMQTEKYQHKGNRSTGTWETTVYTFFYKKLNTTGIGTAATDNGTAISFSDNILRVRDGIEIENNVYSSDGRLVYRGCSAEENLSGLGKGLYIVRSTVDGSTSVRKVTVR